MFSQTKSQTPNSGPKLLIAYFRSGWAFLIPYLAAYLLYAWLKWPVNPAAGAAEVVAGVNESSNTSSSLSPSPSSLLPSLLHVYWALHAAHLGLGIIALRSWWKGSILNLQLFANVSEGITSENVGQTHVPRARGNSATSTGALGASAAGLQSPVSALQSPSSILHSPLSVLLKSAPWLLLALIFWIPGVYLEFPSDPWAHYARINEWSSLDLVSQHSAWAKSSYFLAYSLLGHITPPLRQLEWLDIYYTACCLLLCWQYYLLGLAVGCGKQAAFIFVLLQALLFGNNIFGFYRYYGFSSALVAQLAAVTLTRILLEYSLEPDRDPSHNRPWFSGAITLACLVSLIAFNHIQGLGIAALGMASGVAWRLIRWRRSMAWYLAAGAVAISAAMVLWWPKQAALTEVYRPTGWLSAWYGFDLLRPQAPAAAHAMEIFGLIGLLNLAAGLLLLLRNQAAGWLTVGPVALLCLPIFAVPIANSIAASQHGAMYITTFSRLLFTIPPGLALVTLPFAIWGSWLGEKVSFRQPSHRIRLRNAVPPILILSALLILLLTPADRLFRNRLWHTLAIVPTDLGLQHVLACTSGSSSRPEPGAPGLPVAATPGIGYALAATGVSVATQQSRLMLYPRLSPPSTNLEILLAFLESARAGNRPAQLQAPSYPSLYTPASLSAFLSGHWLPREVALGHSGEAEMVAVSRGDNSASPPAGD